MRRGTCRFCGEGVSWSWVGGEEMPPRAGMRFKGFAGSEMSPSPHRANQPPTEASAQARNPSHPSSRNHNSPSPSIPYDTTPTQPAHRTTTHATETPTVSDDQGNQPATRADHNLRRERKSKSSKRRVLLPPEDWRGSEASEVKAWWQCRAAVVGEALVRTLGNVGDRFTR